MAQHPLARIFYSAIATVLLLIAGTAGAETITLTVHDYPAGDGLPGLVSNGIPFDKGVLLDESKLRLMDGGVEQSVAVRVLARWHGDNSIRAVVLQFNANFGAGTKDYSLRIGESRTTPDLAVTPVTWDFPKKIATMPAAYMCKSRVVWEQTPLGSSAFPTWEQKQLSNYGSINFDNASLTDCANANQFYNAIHSSYQLYARSGEFTHLINSRKWALHHARDQIYLSGDKIGHGICSQWYKTRYTYIQGLVDDYFFWGDNETLDVAGIVADNFYLLHGDNYYYVAPNERNGFWSEREPAFALIGLIAYYEATNDVTYLNKATARIDALHQMQADNGGAAWVHSLYDHDPSECGDTASFGVSPWMSGLLLEAVVKYHKLTGYNKARESVIWALDYLKNCMATGAYAGKSFTYMCGCTNPVYTDGEPDVDNLIPHAFAYGYKITGDEQYKNIAMDVMGNAVDNGWAGSAKHYNQQFRSSGHTVAYLSDAVPTLLASFSASYRDPGVAIGWELAEEGIGMQFFVLKKKADDEYFIEVVDPNITSVGLEYEFTDDDVNPAESYRYRIEVVDEDGRNILFETAPITVPALSVTMRQVYPNPFNVQASISYTIAETAPIALRVYDVSGRLVRTLVRGTRPNGTHVQIWDGLNAQGAAVASGVYYFHLQANGKVHTRKAVLVR